MTNAATQSDTLVEALPDTSPYLETAQAIAAHLARTAVWDGDRCNWIGSATEPVNGMFQNVQRACGADVYAGTAGVAQFFSQLLARQPDAALEETLEGAVNHVLRDQATTAGTSNYAYYCGALGLASTLLELGERHARADWTAAGLERLEQVCAQPVQDHEIDVISGVAGAVPVLLRIMARHPDPRLGEAAVRCGDFLVSKASKQPNAWAWEALAGQPAMTGYSHGAAGIALALLELYRATGNPTYYTGAMMGFNFERLLFNPQLQNWPDLRELNAPGLPAPAADTPPSYGDAWCHGAPGIALSRLRAWQLTGDEAFRQEAEIALNTTHRGIYHMLTAPAAQVSFSLCHGLAGNADIMLDGSRILQNGLYRQVAEAAGTYGIERFHRPGLSWPSGVNDPSGATPGRAEAPGLLLGLAGTGYFYLRLAFPEKVDSVLVL
jgi:lantibiotic modifying enzyme